MKHNCSFFSNLLLLESNQMTNFHVSQSIFGECPYNYSHIDFSEARNALKRVSIP